jgi:hypothetical protein
MNLDDIVVWADNTWCYVHELRQMSHMSDDYEIVSFETEDYDSFLFELESL